MKSIFRTQGLHSVAVDNGDNIIEVIHEHEPSLIFLDVSLDKHDGRELCALIKQNCSTCLIPVVMISGNPDVETYAHLQYPPNDILPKPFDVKQLMDILGKYFPGKMKIRIKA